MSGRLVRARLLRGSIRETILRAYIVSCALSRLGRLPLPEAADLAPVYMEDEKAGYLVPGDPAPSKLRHDTCDENDLDIALDFKIKVRADLVEERDDDPVPQCGIEGLHDGDALLPSRMHERLDRDAPTRRHKVFRRGRNTL